jgi:molybdopterin converting factor small subunit
MVRVELTKHLFSFFPQLEGKNIEVKARTAKDVVDELEKMAPGIRFYLCDERGCLRTHVNLFIGDERVVDRAGLSDRIEPGTRVTVMQALSGG